MTKLPTKDEIINQHAKAIQLELCKRDYDLLLQYHEVLLDRIEKAISDGATSENIRRWVMSVIDNDLTIIQRCTNAARWVEETQLT